jgi:dienelactone hydrolase
VSQGQAEGLGPIAEATHGAVREVSFVVRRGDRGVPCVLWGPERGPAPPVVLLGHGGGGHKRSERQVRLARWFATYAGISSLAIDGPFHGDRAVPGDGPLDYRSRVVDSGAYRVHNSMRQDWLDAVNLAEQAGWVDGHNVAFLGMSMGTRYGLAACAALGARLRCAVIGKFGLTQTNQLPDGLAANHITSEAAQAIRAPILQHVQWHDELFPCAGQLELFDLFPAPEKVLRGRPGGHTVTRPDDEIAWRKHVTRYLARSANPSP